MIPLLAASEKGTGQTESTSEKKLEMWWELSPYLMNWTLLESKTLEGDSPVNEIRWTVSQKSRASWIGGLNTAGLTANPK